MGSNSLSTIIGEPNSNKSIQEKKPQPKASCKDINAREEAEGNANGFLWPPRSYTCGFCNRQFRSAQALGGHMNVHRRDRARLRRSPPMDHGHRNNSILSSPFSLSSVPFPSRIPSPLLSLSSATSSASTDQMKKMDTTLHGSSSEPLKYLKLSNFSKVKGGKSEGGSRIWKKGKNLARMDMENSLLGSSNDLDLELRLGF